MRAVQHCRKAKDMWDKLQERYEGKSVLSKLSLIKNLLNMKYGREQNMKDHVAILESQFARLAAMNTEYDDATKLAIMISSLRDNTEFEPFVTSIGLLKEDNQEWTQISTLFIEEANRSEKKTV